MELLIQSGGRLEPKVLGNLVKAIGEYMMKNCCIGGTEGAKCITEELLVKLSWANHLLGLVIHGSKGELIETLKDTDSVASLIRWYLLNSTKELNALNPAYRTTSYDIIASIETKLKEIFSSAGKYSSKLLHKIFDTFTTLNL